MKKLILPFLALTGAIPALAEYSCSAHCVEYRQVDRYLVLRRQAPLNAFGATKEAAWNNLEQRCLKLLAPYQLYGGMYATLRVRTVGDVDTIDPSSVEANAHNACRR